MKICVGGGPCVRPGQGWNPVPTNKEGEKLYVKKHDWLWKKQI